MNGQKRKTLSRARKSQRDTLGLAIEQDGHHVREGGDEPERIEVMFAPAHLAELEKRREAASRLRAPS